jgi:hypothetical protein
MICEHHSSRRRDGSIGCSKCRADYVIDVLGSRWVEPEPAPDFLYRQKGRRAA